MVHTESHLINAIALTKSEAQAAFNNDKVYLEKYLQNPRHIEIQVLGDGLGAAIYLGERDCSIQRRHQKIIEEAPAPNLSESLRTALYQAAITVAHAINYHGAGTVEFLVDEHQHFYFMEMNTRLQVEHPVTEMISGLDLVEWQLRIAANESLPATQDTLQITGHAIECRIYAEDPLHGFLPSMGQLHVLNEPVLEGVRIDSGVTAGDTITQYYDPMFAKIIAWGDSREQARLRLNDAIAHYIVEGVKTNCSFLQAILTHPDFIKTKLSTDFLSRITILPIKADEQYALMMAASLDYLLTCAVAEPVLADTFGWQMHLSSQWSICYQIANINYTLTIFPQSSHTFIVQYHDIISTLHVTQKNQIVFIDNGTQCMQSQVELHDNVFTVYTKAGPLSVVRNPSSMTASNIHPANSSLTAPMPATIVALLKQPGDQVSAGDSLLILEAMKMEHTIYMPVDGLLIEFFYPVGAQVQEGALLAAIDASSHNKG